MYWPQQNRIGFRSICLSKSIPFAGSIRPNAPLLQYTFVTARTSARQHAYLLRIITQPAHTNHSHDLSRVCASTWPARDMRRCVRGTANLGCETDALLAAHTNEHRASHGPYVALCCGWHSPLARNFHESLFFWRKYGSRTPLSSTHKVVCKHSPWKRCKKINI